MSNTQKEPSVEEMAKWLIGRIAYVNGRDYKLEDQFQIFVEIDVNDVGKQIGKFPCILYDLTTNKLINDGVISHYRMKEYFLNKRAGSWIILS